MALTAPPLTAKFYPELHRQHPNLHRLTNTPTAGGFYTQELRWKWENSVLRRGGEPLTEVYSGRKWNSKDIATAGVVAAMHLLCGFAPFTFNWRALMVAIGLYVVTGLLGITLCFHRNLSHRSFKLPKWLEYTFAYCGVQALQGNPIDWVSTHRYHHQYCDFERDPHSSIEGFWFSHMSWLFDTDNITKMLCFLSPPFTKLQHLIHTFYCMQYGEQNNVGDLEKQPFYRFLRKTYIIHPIAFTLLLYATGGLPFVLWGMVYDSTSKFEK
ncbi:hypothetical protein E3N88_05521 [Mikania micrantha]|uniref:Fatty acid desaturase domain-containing protein n=1 Tax=Mikania micrantha TaxID=192012 RepID=A0A5N6PN23_9ASTR|nr:hypothetical protein E3N88_05521 [Mikania micrantha]